MKQWKSGKLILQGKGYACVSQMDPTNSHGFLFRRSAPRKPPALKIERKRPNPRKEEIPVQAMVALEISKNRTQRHLPHDLPT